MSHLEGGRVPPWHPAGRPVRPWLLSRRAVRRHRAAAQLGLHPVAEPGGAAAVVSGGTSELTAKPAPPARRGAADVAAE